MNIHAGRRTASVLVCSLRNAPPFFKERTIFLLPKISFPVNPAYNFAIVFSAQCVHQIGASCLGRSAAPQMGCGYSPLALRLVISRKIVTGSIDCSLYSSSAGLVPLDKVVSTACPSHSILRPVH